MGYYNKLAYAIYNDVVSGLRGLTSNPTISIEQLEDDIIDERLQIIKEYQLKGILPKEELLLSINCINIDCKPIDQCPSCTNTNNDYNEVAHFQIPQLITEFGNSGIEYIGSTDMNNPFIVYTNQSLMMNHQYRRRGKNKPYVYIRTTPNENNMYDGFIFNAPLLNSITVVGIFKDPRQLEQYGCCPEEDINNLSFIDNEIKNRLTKKKLQYYRQFAAPVLPNDQQPK